MSHGNDMLARARRCRKTAEAMREQAARLDAMHDVERALRRKRSAENLDALAHELELQATLGAPTPRAHVHRPGSIPR